LVEVFAQAEHKFQIRVLAHGGSHPAAHEIAEGHPGVDHQQDSFLHGTSFP